MAGRAAKLPELVRDSKLPTSFESNLITHNKPSGRRNAPRREIWSQERMLGHGGNGIIWLQRRVDRTSMASELRAVKQIRVNTSSKGKHYWRELEALAKFSQDKYSDFFIQTYGWYEDSVNLYVAMEYCEHGDLGLYLKNFGKLPEDQVQYLSAQILGAISMMHGVGFAHLDIKPANILIKSKPPADWWVKVCDLGLSKRTENAAGSTTVRATPGFMPPEFHGFDPDPIKTSPLLSDIWCYGETIFQMLVGRGTFSSNLELLNYCKGEIEFPAKGSDASKDAIDFIRSLMKANPRERMTAVEAQGHRWMAPSMTELETIQESDLLIRKEEDSLSTDLPADAEWTQPSAAWSEPDANHNNPEDLENPDNDAGSPSSETNGTNRKWGMSNKHFRTQKFQPPHADDFTESESGSDDSWPAYNTNKTKAPLKSGQASSSKVPSLRILDADNVRRSPARFERDQPSRPKEAPPSPTFLPHQRSAPEGPSYYGDEKGDTSRGYVEVAGSKNRLRRRPPKYREERAPRYRESSQPEANSHTALQTEGSSANNISSGKRRSLKPRSSAYAHTYKVAPDGRATLSDSYDRRLEPENKTNTHYRHPDPGGSGVYVVESRPVPGRESSHSRSAGGSYPKFTKVDSSKSYDPDDIIYSHYPASYLDEYPAYF